MKTDYSNVIIAIVMILLVQVSWYHLTLPGSVLFPNKNNDKCKPSIKRSIVSYLTYVIPMFAVGYFVMKSNNNNIEKTCAAMDLYSAVLCKK